MNAKDAMRLLLEATRQPDDGDITPEEMWEQLDSKFCRQMKPGMYVTKTSSFGHEYPGIRGVLGFRIPKDTAVIVVSSTYYEWNNEMGLFSDVKDGPLLLSLVGDHLAYVLARTLKEVN